MPGDSIVISNGDTIYYNGPESLPSELDSYPELKKMIIERLGEHKVKPEDNTGSYFGIALTIIIAIGILAFIYRVRRSEVIDDQVGMSVEDEPLTRPNYQVFKGTSLHFDDALLHSILEKYNPYYKMLVNNEQKRFVQRLQSFLKEKTFMIPADEGYREMPVLISASAIQLTFGLKDYLLPWFQYICVHPREYIMTQPLRTLAGNVSGNTITLSWKHFLEDYKKQDGSNVGLHEMAHALQRQYEYFYKEKGQEFRKAFDQFNSLDENIRAREKGSFYRFYTEYALTNTDEFWACSVELFFEKPVQLYQHYPQIYDVIKMLLKQDLVGSAIEPCLSAQKNL